MPNALDQKDIRKFIGGIRRCSPRAAQRLVSSERSDQRWRLVSRMALTPIPMHRPKPAKIIKNMNESLIVMRIKSAAASLSPGSPPRNKPKAQAQARCRPAMQTLRSRTLSRRAASRWLPWRRRIPILPSFPFSSHLQLPQQHMPLQHMPGQLSIQKNANYWPAFVSRCVPPRGPGPS
jgi:hypothetical protein